MHSSTFLLIVIALRNAKLALFDSKFAFLILGAEIVIAVTRNEWQVSPVTIVQFFAMLTTATIVLYNTRNRTLRFMALMNRFVALFAAGAFYFSPETHWFRPNVPSPMWITLAIASAFTAATSVQSWFDWCVRHDDNNRESTTLRQSVVPAMNELASLAPFSRLINIFLWCCCNSLAEEVFSRLILYESLILTGFTPSFAMLVQAIDFGMLHLHHGLPFRRSGFILSALFGLSQGALYIGTGGLLIPWIVHALIDCYIFNKIAS